MSSWKDLSGFTYGRNEVSPDSEQIELTMPARHNSETLWAWSKSKTNYLIQDLAHVKQFTTLEKQSDHDKIHQWLDSETSSEWLYNFYCSLSSQRCVIIAALERFHERMWMKRTFIWLKALRSNAVLDCGFLLFWFFFLFFDAKEEKMNIEILYKKPGTNPAMVE